MFKGLLPPTILQRHRPVKHWLARLRIHAVRDKVAVPLELVLLIRVRGFHALF